MAYSDAQNKATQRYQKKNYDSLLIRFKKGYTDAEIKPAASRAGESVNGYIKKAVADRIEREKTE